MENTYIFHRGTIVSASGRKLIQKGNKGSFLAEGSTIMQTIDAKTMSCRRYNPDSIFRKAGFDCARFAHIAKDSVKGTIPVIIQGKIDRVAYERYSNQFYLILNRGYSDDPNFIEYASGLISANAVIINAEGFSFDDFLKYDGELLINEEVVQNPDFFKDCSIEIYDISQVYDYGEFIDRLEDKTIEPMDISNELSEDKTK